MGIPAFLIQYSIYCDWGFQRSIFGHVPLMVPEKMFEGWSRVTQKSQIQVARLRDLALVSINDAENPPFDETERICSAAKAWRRGGPIWRSLATENGWKLMEDDDTLGDLRFCCWEITLWISLNAEMDLKSPQGFETQKHPYWCVEKSAKLSLLYWGPVAFFNC